MIGRLESSNIYPLDSPECRITEGEAILFAYEESNTIGRQFLGGHHPLTITVVATQGQPIITAARKFYWILSHLNILTTAFAIDLDFFEKRASTRTGMMNRM